ncbi:MAG: MAPEG family protein [Rhodospirillales bacterium]|nr:MAPEG family protein [Rhodospirillales bacterium]MBN8898347.1 MAPEG family protein [Rhodospirillales bacterium]
MRRKSVLLATIGLIAALLVWRLLTAVLLPAPTGTPYQRLAIGIAALLPAVTVLAAMILAQMAARFSSVVIDPTAGRETRFLLVNQRVISNTVEQLAVFVPALLAFAAHSLPGDMPAIVALGIVFALARLAFWAGYLRAPLFRAPGMAATAGANLAALAAAIWVWLA